MTEKYGSQRLKELPNDIARRILQDGSIGGSDLGDLSQTGPRHNLSSPPQPETTYQKPLLRTPPKDTYGSPHLKDATAGWEKMIDAAAREMVKDVLDMGPKFLNRPLGSKPVPIDDQKVEYANRLTVPDFWAMKFQSYIDRGIGPAQAAIALLEWEQKVRE